MLKLFSIELNMIEVNSSFFNKLMKKSWPMVLTSSLISSFAAVADSPFGAFAPFLKGYFFVMEGKSALRFHENL